jgi:hypothetical protein
MVKNYSKQLNSLSNTKRGGGGFGVPTPPPMGVTYPDKERVKPVGITVDKINTKLKTIKKEATLVDIQNLAILKDFNTAFIGYLRQKAKEGGDNANAFKNLFGENGKINDILYSRLINGKSLNNKNFPTKNQINTLKKNNSIKSKVCKNNQQNNGLVTAGVEGNPAGVEGTNNQGPAANNAAAKAAANNAAAKAAEAAAQQE